MSRDGVFDVVGSAVAASGVRSGSSSTWPASRSDSDSFFCWAVLSYAIYGILVWRRHGVLIMKDRLATVAIWTGAVIALVALLAVVVYVVVKGAPVVFADFPRFLVNDMTGGKIG